MITVYHGDCVEHMRGMDPGSINTIFADPPYNTGNTTDKTVKYDRNEDFASKHWQNFKAEWDSINDYALFTRLWLEQARRLLADAGSIWICGTFHNIPTCAITLQQLGFYTIQWVQWCIPNAFPHLSGKKMGNSNQTLIWARKGDRHYYDYAAAKAFNGGKNLRDYWIINNDCLTGRVYKHPSKKPVDLVKRALAISTPDAGTVLDPFAGSGTTGIAAASLGLQSILIEQEGQYIDMMLSRFNTARIDYQ